MHEKKLDYIGLRNRDSQKLNNIRLTFRDKEDSRSECHNIFDYLNVFGFLEVQMFDCDT